MVVHFPVRVADFAQTTRHTAEEALHTFAEGSFSPLELAQKYLREVDGMEDLVHGFIQWIVLWTTLFYLIAGTYSYWGKRFGESTKPHENNRYWAARVFWGTIHSAVVSTIAVWALVQWIGAPTSAQFTSSSHLDTCRADQDGTEQWNNVGQATAVVGLLFTAFTLVDIVLSWFHGLITWDYLVHHTAFLLAGLIIRGQCILPFNASVLLSMEISTPFLNLLTFFRNRGERWTPLLVVCGATFFVLYVIFRLLLNTYATILLWVRAQESDTFPGRMPAYQVYFLLIAITVGYAVQIYWFPRIAQMFGANLKALLFDGQLDEDTVFDEPPIAAAGAPGVEQRRGATKDARDSGSAGSYS